MSEPHGEDGGLMSSGPTGLNLKSIPPQEDSCGGGGRGVTRKAGGQGNVTQACPWVIQNKSCLVYPCRRDVKASNLLKLETWSIHKVKSPLIP